VRKIESWSTSLCDIIPYWDLDSRAHPLHVDNLRVLTTTVIVYTYGCVCFAALRL